VKRDIDLGRCFVFPYAACWVEDVVGRTMQKNKDFMLLLSKVLIRV
jgi:hypothetical protein